LIVARLAIRAGPLVHWLWRNREQFSPVLRKAGDFATAAVSDPNGAIRRVGNAIVFGQPDGGSKVIAFIEQTALKLDHIEQAVTGVEAGQTAMLSSPESLQAGQHALSSSVASVQAGQTAMMSSLQSLQAGQHALSSSVASLQSLSMVSLGFTAILPVVLHMQYASLSKRLNTLIKVIHGLDKKFDADKIAVLRTGIDLLRLGMDSHEQLKGVDARQHYNAGLHDCIRSVHYFHTLLSDQLAAKSPNRDEVRVLARHLSVAVLGVASCHIGLEDDGQAITQIEQQVPLLQQAAKRVFKETAGKDPARFLGLPVGNREVSLAFMADLFQQAKQAGVVETQRDFTPAEWFEEHRDTISPFSKRLPRMHKSRYMKGLRQELVEAVASVEEFNRVRGVELLASEVRAAGECSREVMGQLRRTIDSGAGDEEHLVWSLVPKPA
jgi:hypothetical protein